MHGHTLCCIRMHVLVDTRERARIDLRLQGVGGGRRQMWGTLHPSTIDPQPESLFPHGFKGFVALSDCVVRGSNERQSSPLTPSFPGVSTNSPWIRRQALYGAC